MQTSARKAKILIPRLKKNVRKIVHKDGNKEGKDQVDKNRPRTKRP